MLRPITCPSRPDAPSCQGARRTRLREPLNTPNAACLVRACDGSDVGHQHPYWLEITSGSGPCSTKQTTTCDRDLRGFDGGSARTTKAAGRCRKPPGPGVSDSRRRRWSRSETAQTTTSPTGRVHCSEASDEAMQPSKDCSEASDEAMQPSKDCIKASDEAMQPSKAGHDVDTRSRRTKKVVRRSASPL